MMKVWTILVSGLMVLNLSAGAQGQSAPLPSATAYLGQHPPGLNAEPFAPGLVTSSGFEYGGVFSPDMDEFYFIRSIEDDGTQEFVVFRHDDGVWRETVLSQRIGQPFIAPDGETLHLGGRYMERTESGWSEIRTLGPQFQGFQIMRLTASSAGTYCFDEIGSADGDGVLRCSRVIDGVRDDPEPLPEGINSGSWNAHPFIAPDESYILWDGRREGGFGDSDIYVSFRQADGAWGPARNLGDRVNTEAWEASASVTPDGEYLFFHRMVRATEDAEVTNVDILWVDADILETLRPASLGDDRAGSLD